MRAPLRGGAISGVWERMKGWISELIVMIRQGGAMAVLRRAAPPGVGGTVAIGLAVWFFMYGRKRLRARRPPGPRAPADPGAVPPELADLMRTVDARWKRSGHPRPAGRAPLEHLRGLPAPARVGEAVVETFYRCRYGGIAPSDAELAGLRAGLAERR